MPAKGKEIKKREPRTPKEKAFVKEYLANGGNKVQAALKVYDTDSYKSATRIAHENAEKLRLVDHFDQVEGLRPQDRLLKLVEGLNAVKSISGMGDAGSKSIEFVEVPDFSTRYKYLELTFKLDGSLKSAETVNNTQINVMPILGAHEPVHPDDGDEQAAEAEKAD